MNRPLSVQPLMSSSGLDGISGLSPSCFSLTADFPHHSDFFETSADGKDDSGPSTGPIPQRPHYHRRQDLTITPNTEMSSTLSTPVSIFWN